MTDPTHDPSPLPPPAPADAPGTRPKLDLLRMWVQVVLVQIGIERRELEKAARAQVEQAEKAKGG